MHKTNRRKERAAAEAIRVVTPPPRAVMSANARAKLAKGESITPEENRLLMFSLPRKTRRANKIRTTGIREEIAAMRSIIHGPEPVGDRTPYVRPKAPPRPSTDGEVDITALDEEKAARRLTTELRKSRDAARRARFDAARKAK